MAYPPEIRRPAGGALGIRRPILLEIDEPTSRRSELPGLDLVTLHLEVQGLVIHLEEPSRLALVPPRGLKGEPNRLPLRLGGGSIGDFLQGGARLFSLPAVRFSHFPLGHSAVSAHRGAPS